MKKIFSALLIMSLTGCYSPAQINNKTVNNKSDLSVSSNQEIKLSFKLQDAASLSRVKSVDAYLVTNTASPLTSNVYTPSFKYQADVVNGVINITFTNFPVGGPYYVAVQAYDDLKGSATRNNITALNSNNIPFAVSTNSVTYANNSLTYSDASSSLNVSINLIPYNNLPVNVTPVKGTDVTNNDISIG